MAEPAFPFFTDPRGTLVPVELDDVGFEVRRVFAVAGPPGGSTRGEHASVCRELIVLVGGCVEVAVTREGVAHTTLLDRPGSAVAVAPGEQVSYRLTDDRSVVLVLADAPYASPAPTATQQEDPS